MCMYNWYVPLSPKQQSIKQFAVWIGLWKFQVKKSVPSLIKPGSFVSATRPKVSIPDVVTWIDFYYR